MGNSAASDCLASLGGLHDCCKSKQRWKRGPVCSGLEVSSDKTIAATSASSGYLVEPWAGLVSSGMQRVGAMFRQSPKRFAYKVDRQSRNNHRWSDKFVCPMELFAKVLPRIDRRELWQEIAANVLVSDMRSGAVVLQRVWESICHRQHSVRITMVIAVPKSYSRPHSSV